MKMRKIIFIILAVVFMYNTKILAGTLDPNIPKIPAETLALSTDGVATFIPPEYSGKWKRFGVQLLKRITTIKTVEGKQVAVYTYKTSGSIKYCDGEEAQVDLSFPAVGYYQFQVRGENLEGNYGEWSKMSDSNPSGKGEEDWEGIPIDENSISINTGGHSWDTSNTGPGVVQYGTYPYGYQNAVIGPNGQILYYIGGYGQPNYNQSPNSYNPYYGPGYQNYGQGGSQGQIMYPNTGISNYPQVVAPNFNDSNQSSNAPSGVINSPSSSGTSGVSSVSPNITQGLEIGWHVDGNGRFYYQGNGVVLKGTWYLIDGNYYRFEDNGYLLVNRWYNDKETGYWYYLSGDGKMLTGWQKIGDVWYYFKPENGNGYGAMYANTVLDINDSVWGSGSYAFDSNGAMVRNAWYGGRYYGDDGNRTK